MRGGLGVKTLGSVKASIRSNGPPPPPPPSNLTTWKGCILHPRFILFIRDDLYNKGGGGGGGK